MSDRKCVIIVNETLPVGIVANTVAVLTLSIGKKHPEMVGYDLVDSDGYIHNGITTLPIPVLKAGDKIGKIRTALKQHHESLTIIDVISATSTTRTYDEYAQVMKNTAAEELQYYGVAIYGPKKLVNQHAGSFGLLR